MSAPRALVLAALLVAPLVACGGPPARAPSAPTTHAVENQILGERAEGTPSELRRRGEEALLAQQWQAAVDALEALVLGDPASAADPRVLYDLAQAYEGLGAREKARARYHEVRTRFPTDATARNAIVREASLVAYLEDWAALGEVGDAMLTRCETGCDPADRMLGLGARGLARVQAGQRDLALHDVNEGLDLVEEHRYGMTGQLPVAAAMLKYALGEIRKARSEAIALTPPGPDFVQRLELRCQHLLDAQSAYADAIRSVDPLWAAMSGYRVGEMYRELHGHLMSIPPDASRAKTESDRQLFFAIMHVRYRVLLEKGVEMMNRTLDFGAKTGAAAAWMDRAEAAKRDMDDALVAEKAQLATYPFTEEEVEKAIALMKKHLEEKTAKDAAGAKKPAAAGR